MNAAPSSAQANAAGATPLENNVNVTGAPAAKTSPRRSPCRAGAPVENATSSRSNVAPTPSAARRRRRSSPRRRRRPARPASTPPSPATVCGDHAERFAPGRRPGTSTSAPGGDAHEELDHRLRLGRSDERAAGQLRTRYVPPSRPPLATAVPRTSVPTIAPSPADRRRLPVLERDHRRRRLELRLSRRRDRQDREHGEGSGAQPHEQRSDLPVRTFRQRSGAAVMPPTRTRHDCDFPVAPKR